VLFCDFDDRQAITSQHLFKVTTSVALDPCPATFQTIAARATIGSESCVVVVIYRPGSVDVPQMFFDDLSDLFDRVATTNDALFIVSYLNIHLERPDDVHAQRLRDLFGCYDLVVCNSEPTHDLGGSLTSLCLDATNPVLW